VSTSSATVFPAGLNIHCSGYDHVVVILNTHSDNESGDLWFTSHDEDLKGPASAPIGTVCIFCLDLMNVYLILVQFFDSVFGKAMNDYLGTTKFSAFFLLACGAVVNQAGALAGLQSTVQRYACSTVLFLSDWFSRLSFTDSFAFGAERLISHHAVIWMISYAGQVIVGGQPSKDCISNLLYALSIGKHTSVVFINKIGAGTTATFTCSQYIWEHRSLRPNGFTFPLGCPECRHIYCWRIMRSADGAPTRLACTTRVGDERCAGTWEFPPLPSSSALDAPYVGTWRKI
jgi:hypothetical protein